MRWPWRHRPAPNGHAAARAERDATEKLRALADQEREVTAAVDAFTAAVQAALVGRRRST